MRWDQQRVIVTGGASFNVTDNSLAGKLLGWEPQVRFVDGLHRTIDSYFSAKKRPEVAAILDQVLTERTAKPVASQVATAD